MLKSVHYNTVQITVYYGTSNPFYVCEIIIAILSIIPLCHHIILWVAIIFTQFISLTYMLVSLIN